MNDYIIKSGKKLRKGFTTGSCAAAAAKACAIMLFEKIEIPEVSLTFPGGEEIILKPEDITLNEASASCCIIKDAGDDPDVTNGIRIYARVEKAKAGISIDGGIGVGRVTSAGLPCKIGEAAINPGPRKMIFNALEEVARLYKYDGGFHVEIFVPQGVEIAKKTFNERLGIVEGISILGTTGIVEPMSEKALIDSLKVEMQVIKERGFNSLLAFPGNYAVNFIDSTLGIRGENSLKFSNYLGEVLDFAVELDYKEILIVGHIGKMVKVAGGMMNTHSHTGDFRMEVLSCYAGLYGGGSELIAEILSSVTTEQALDLLKGEGLLKKVVNKISERALFYINKRVDNKIKTNLIIYSNNHGILN